MTATELMNSAAKALGHLRPGSTLNNSANDDCLRVLNSMIGSANALSSNIFTRRVAQYTMTANKQSYTIGDPAVGGATDIAAVRPQRIEEGGVNLFLTTNPIIRRPIRLVDDTEWANIRLQAVYTFPEVLYYDGGNYDPGNITPGYPTLYFHPIPAAAYTWEMYTWEALKTLDNPTAEIVFPPGYDEMLIYGLAIRIAPLLNAAVPPDVRVLAQRAEAAIQSLNSQAPKLKNDIASRGRTGVNWISRTWY
jgi:hypothetical protein